MEHRCRVAFLTRAPRRADGRLSGTTYLTMGAGRCHRYHVRIPFSDYKLDTAKFTLANKSSLFFIEDVSETSFITTSKLL
jgi:hypothetical protein